VLRRLTVLSARVLMDSRGSSRRIPRQTMPEAVVPYLRMSGRWLEEHGFAIGADVQVLVEQSRVTLISRHEG
jgi:hypothetical protein